MRFLYARVSSCDGSQKIDRQTTEIEKYDEVFEDYASGGSTNRPKLQEMLKWVRKGDIVEVHSIDRLARNINDLLQIVKTITEERHAEIYFIKENLRFTDDTNNPFNKLTLQIIGSIAEFERNMIKMRQKEGILIAKQRGVYSKERCKKLSLSKIEELKKILPIKLKSLIFVKNMELPNRHFTDIKKIIIYEIRRNLYRLFFQVFVEGCIIHVQHFSNLNFFNVLG